MPTPKPQYTPPVRREHLSLYDQQFLGGTIVAGTYYDLWYVRYEREGVKSIPTIYAVHGDPPEDREDYTRMISSTAGLLQRHNEYPGLRGWRTGANVALDEADRRAAFMELPMK